MRKPKEFVYSQKIATEFTDDDAVEFVKRDMRRKMGEAILLEIEAVGKSAAWIEGVKWINRKENIDGFITETIELMAKVETEYT